MTFSEAMELLKSGSKVSRLEWKDSIYFEMQGDIICSWQPVVEHYLYTEDIMISEGWMLDGFTEPQSFCAIIPYLQGGARAWMKNWDDDFFITLDPTSGLVLHKMSLCQFQPTFADFLAIDWVAI